MSDDPMGSSIYEARARQGGPVKRYWRRMGRVQPAVLLTVFVVIFLLAAANTFAVTGDFPGLLIPGIAALLWTLGAAVLWEATAWMVRRLRGRS